MRTGPPGFEPVRERVCGAHADRLPTVPVRQTGLAEGVKPTVLLRTATNIAAASEELRAGPPARLRADTLATPIGTLFIVCDARSLVGVDFDGCEPRMHAGLARRFGPYELAAARDPLGVTTALERYFAGDLAALEALPADPGGTPYQQRVWASLRTIPPGQTRSYGALAAQLGGTHARAVGHANSLNPVAIVVPCHRVIGADAALVGYAGGLSRKRWLLDHEAACGVVPLPL